MLPTQWKGKIAKLKGEPRAIAKAIAGGFSPNGVLGASRSAKDVERIGLLGWRKGMEVADGFAPGGDHCQAVAALIGPDNAALARRLWERRGEYPYDNPGGLPFRTTDKNIVPVSAHAYTVMSFIEGLVAGFSVDAYLGECAKGDKAVRFGKEWNYVDQVLAQQLDEAPDADALFARIEGIVTDDSGGGSVTGPILAGLVRCRRPQAHALAEKLLLGAGLMESTRQTVLRSAGVGCREAFRHLFKVAVDNDLFRFSSAIEAFNYWTGLSFKATPPDTVKNAAVLARQCLDGKAFRKKRLTGPDPLGMYLALWAESQQDDMGSAVKTASAILADGKRKNRATAAYFLSRLPDRRARLDAAAGILRNSRDRENGQLMGFAFRLFEGVGLRLAEHAPDNFLGGDSAVEISPDEARRLYGIFKEALESLPDKTSVFKNEFFLTSRVSLDYSAGDLFGFMIRCAARAVVRPKEIRAEHPGQPVSIDGIDPYADVRAKWSLPARRNNPLRSPFVPDSLDDDPPGVNIRDDLCSYADLMSRGKSAGLSSLVLPSLIWSVVRDGSGSPVQKETLMRLLGDPRADNEPWRYCADLELTEEECRRIEGLVKNGDGTLRQNVIVRLLKRDPAGLGRSVQRLLADADAPVREVGKELLNILARRKDDPEYSQVYADCLKAAGGSVQEKAAAPTVARVGDTNVPIISFEDFMSGRIGNRGNAATPDEDGGYGLYDTAVPPPAFVIPDIPDIAAKDAGKTVFPVELKELTDFLDAVEAVVVAHVGEEYEAIDRDGSKTTVVVGSAQGLPLRWQDGFDTSAIFRSNFTGYSQIDNYPFADEWRRMFEQLENPAECVIFFNHIFCDSTAGRLPFSKEDTGPKFPAIPWCARADELISGIKAHMAAHIKYPGVANILGKAFEKLIPPNRRYPALCRLYLAFQAEQRRQSDRRTPSCVPLQSLRDCLDSEDDARFVDFFKILYDACYGPQGVPTRTQGMQSTDIVRAHRLGLLRDNDVPRLLIAMSRDEFQEMYPDEYRVGNSLKLLTTRRLANRLFQDNPHFKEIIDRFAAGVVRYELGRGEMSTPLSITAGEIASFTGEEFFVELLQKLGDAELKALRYSPVHQGNSVKGEMFLYLLYHCYPTAEDDGGKFAAAVKDGGISDQRLLDAAMLASQWIGPVSRHLGWKNLESLCWYFQAHINDGFSTEKANAVARFSDIAPEEFNDGACDLGWYRAARAGLDDKQCKAVYKAAKNVTNGPRYRRAQLFADAIDGKFRPEDIERDIVEKRSQAKALFYGLIPFDKKNSRKDMAHRYAVLQKFLKESRQFGVQRRTSEARAVALGTQNLARNAGYDNATRFVWEMEDALASESDPFARRSLGDDGAVAVWLEAEDDGDVAVRVEKNGKPQKTVPAAFKKDPGYLDLVETKKDWRDRQSRNRRALEQAMVHGEVFDLADLARLAKNPIFSALFSSLVFKAGDRLDYLDNLTAAGVKGEAVVAHPYHLKTAGVWEKFQRDLFDRRLRQPFKQVFRELYVPTRDEENAFASQRYQGHQVRPARAVGVMKSQGWIANFDGGMEKTFRRENISVWMHSNIVWLGDVMVENPTIGGVAFSRRPRGFAWRGEPLAVKDVPPIVFSETMRDLDLVVSVAFAGGVDPETSQSTLEMRLVLAKEIVRLFKLDNVSFKRSHAEIKGKRGDYTVHLGSGVAHKMASGALNLIAVPSQQRGRIFLPFMDDDPRTAEVMTKILLFARDNEIKDPALLQQINR